MDSQASLPYSQASENNKQPILEILERHLKTTDRVLEIGGGTGQHAVFFAEHLPSIIWQSTDISSSVRTLNKRISAAKLTNLPEASGLDVNQSDWCCENTDAIFTANSLHIMSAPSVENFFLGAGRYIDTRGLLLVYGPFKYNGDFTSESNARFDLWLKDRDSVSGIRDYEWVNQLAENVGLSLLEDKIMPANNQLLIWKKR